MEGVVEAGKVKGPSRLPPVEVLGGPEIFQIPVVRPYLNLVARAFKEVTPLLEAPDDR